MRDPRLVLDYVSMRRGGSRSATNLARTTFAGVPVPPVPTQTPVGPNGASLGLPSADRIAKRRQAEQLYPHMAADPALAELIYGLIRERDPAIVVETGVATGVTSAYALAALTDNGSSGELHSIDLPPLRLIADELVGLEIPPHLRARWHYYWGSSRRKLPWILSRVGRPIDLFIHDSDHSYANMMWELQTAWDSLSARGVLVADDAQMNSAVRDFSRSVGIEPTFMRQRVKPGITAMLVKPAPIDPGA